MAPDSAPTSALRDARPDLSSGAGGLQIPAAERATSRSEATPESENDAALPGPDKGATSGTPGLLRNLISLTKPRLSALVLVTAGGGLWLSDAAPGWVASVAAVVGTTMVVGGANALNCYIERDTDRLMARTARRPLPMGQMRPEVALLFGLFLSAVSVPMLSLMTTPLAGLLAAVALVSYVLVYTPLKRRSSISTLIGALPGALPPLIGWTAATGRLDAGGLVLFAILFIWQIPHSLAIGIYRQKEYESAGLVVFPTEHGLEATRRQMLLYAMPLAPLPLALVHLGVAGPITAVGGSLLGAVFLAMCWDGFRNARGAKWARKTFLASLVYLTALFAVLAVDQWV
jgi:heme o synthase